MLSFGEGFLNLYLQQHLVWLQICRKQLLTIAPELPSKWFPSKWYIWSVSLLLSLFSFPLSFTPPFLLPLFSSSFFPSPSPCPLLCTPYLWCLAPFLPVCCYDLRVMVMNSKPPEPWVPIKCFLYKLPWSWCYFTAIEKQLRHQSSQRVQGHSASDIMMTWDL